MNIQLHWYVYIWESSSTSSYLGLKPSKLEVCLGLKEVGKQGSVQVPKQLSGNLNIQVIQIGSVYVLVN